MIASITNKVYNSSMSKNWNLVDFKCESCGVTIKAFQSRNRVYCSNCSKNRKVESVCQTCGKKEMKHKSRMAKYCSRECWNKSRVGVKRPSIVGRKISNTKLSMPIKTEAGARKRFNTYLYPEVKSCERCGEANRKKINRHHIDKNPFNTDVSNLMYLCQSCHQRHHRNWEKRKAK